MFALQVPRLRLGLAIAAVVVAGCMFFGAPTSAAPPSEQEMAARIDALLAARWKQEGVTPAASASDAEFLRRASLDLTGTIPTVNEVREFLADTSADKHRKLIDSLLKKPTHATHFSNVWRNALLPVDANQVFFGGDNGFRSWLRSQFSQNVPYDKIVTDVLVARGQGGQVGPALFYTALQLKPEELAASTSKIFLGVQIQCAQCHNHPFDHWKQDDFWGYAAFFGQLAQPQGNQQFAAMVTDADTGDVKLPESEVVVKPKFLAGEASEDGVLTRRMRLALWMTSRDNAFFSRAAVNRVWAMLFGRGIVEPVDDLGGKNAPSHPEVLDELSKYFADTGFDLNRLIRTLAATKAYQLSSASDGENRPELFARMAIKSLTADQMYDCLQDAMRRRELSAYTGQPGQQFAGGFDQLRQQFLARFNAPGQGTTEFHSGIPQALMLMNGQVIVQATNLQQSDLLGALDAPFFSDDDRLEILFLSTLSRFPTDDERPGATAHLENASNKRQALSDVLWALLNSAEFALNH
ncbi:MAG: DUF1549 domain-containing protein [Planctomycetia bacterium]|nr:DUF1549 domain-containing protein [Planctomycetia bacterium]